MPVPKINILGVNVSAVDLDDVVGIITDWICKKERNYVCVTGVHGVMESQYDKNIKLIHNSAGLVTPDGMPLVWLSRLRGLRNVRRVYGPDLMLAVCKSSLDKGFRHFFYGATDNALKMLVSNLEREFPGISIAGSYAPPFRPLTEKEDQEVISVINKARPDIVWIGLSTPKQERWMARHLSSLDASVLIGAGAAFDFHTGLKKQAPCWMQKIGLEWFFRLLSEPKRLWRRYLVNNTLFILLIFAETAATLFKKQKINSV